MAASWTERHGFGDNVNGTLQWASRNNDPESGDWVGCARALVEYGMPATLGGHYSPQVADFLADVGRPGGTSLSGQHTE